MPYTRRLVGLGSLLEEPYTTPFTVRDSERLDELIQNTLARTKLLETPTRKVNFSDLSSPLPPLSLEGLR